MTLMFLSCQASVTQWVQLLTVAHLLNSKVKSVGYEEYNQGAKQQKGEYMQSNIYLIKASIGDSLLT